MKNISVYLTRIVQPPNIYTTNSSLYYFRLNVLSGAQFEIIFERSISDLSRRSS